MRTPPSARPKAKTAKAADPALGGRPGRGEILERVLAAAGETDTGLALRLEAATAVIGMVNERTAPGALRAWDAWQAERYQRGEISRRPGYADNPFRPR